MSAGSPQLGRPQPTSYPNPYGGQQAPTMNPGMSFGQGMGAFSGGMQLGSTMAQFLANIQSAKWQQDQQEAAYGTSLGALKNLLGIGFAPIDDWGLAPSSAMVGRGQERTGPTWWPSSIDELDQADETYDDLRRQLEGLERQRAADKADIHGVPTVKAGAEQELFDSYMNNRKDSLLYSDQVVDPGSFESRYMAPGTVVARKPGDNGMDPRVAEMRKTIYGAMQRGGAISPEDEATLQLIQGQQLGAQSAVGPTSDMQGSLASLVNLGGAGGQHANLATQVAGENLAYRQAARQLGMQALMGIYGNAQVY